MTGVVPPEAPARSSGYESLTPPRRIEARISADVEAAILCAMDLDATRRFRATKPLANALLGTGWATAQPVGAASGNARSGRWRLAVAGLGLVLVAFLAGILISRQPAGIEPVGKSTVAVLTYTAFRTPVPATVNPSLLDAHTTATQASAVTPMVILGTETALATPTKAVLPTSTPVPPTPTDLPPPTSTPILLTPTPTMMEHAFPISLVHLANASTEEGYETPPLGAVVLGGIPFDLPSGQNSATTQAEPLPGNPTILTVEPWVERPQQVYLLVTAGNLYTEYKNRSVGVVRLRFASGSAGGTAGRRL
ncbi:MAG: hypothetical protein HZY76_00410 [Anaerolineae bacterium]|nr:MAG: hypothetical protein HZY76_00410 [Anaerolineae bacterium]